MSINVHVSGNPISINRGKMVTVDLDHSKKEFEKRRLMRLEQVRQQSKNIAEDVRNKVKREKITQMKQIEEEGKQKLKNWQNRKLLELQTQYKKALKELGAGHKQAKELEDEDTFLQEKTILNQEISAKRGHKAACKLHSKNNEIERNKNTLLERKKIVREIENTRAAMLTNFPKPNHHNEPRIKKKKHRDINDELKISIPDSDSDFQGRSNSLSNITEEVDESTSCTCDLEDSTSSDIEDNTKNTVNRPTEANTAIPFTEAPKLIVNNTPISSRNVNNNLPESTKLYSSSNNQVTSTINSVTAPQSSMQHEMQQLPIVTEQCTHSCFKGTPCDTRISDRIKHRGFSSQPHKITVAHPVEIPQVQSSTAIKEHINSRICCLNCPCGCVPKQPMSKNLSDRLDYQVGDLQDTYKNYEDKIPATSEINNYGNKSQHLDEIKSKVEGSTTNDEIPSKPFIKVKTPSSETSKKSETAKLKIPSKVITSKKSPSKKTSKIVVSSINTDNLSSQERSSQKLNEILKSSGSRQHPIQVYDHSNKFSYEKNVPTSSFVEKIPFESLEVIPDPEMETDWKETQRKREKDAQIRGKQALEKAKLQKDYEDMLKRLPLLQKKERISEINNDKPEYHMTDERLKEREKIKQNQLENAYNKLFPNLQPAIVTLNKNNQAEGHKASDTDSSNSINIANWDVDYKAPQMFTPQEVQDILKSFTRQDPESRRTKLKELLKNLKLQKEELLREISALPKDDSVNEIINDLRSFDSEDNTKTKSKRKVPRKRCRKENEANVSIDSSIDGSSNEQSKSGNKEGKSPRKKAKIKQKIIILQNTSTQTTPKQIRENFPVSVQDTSVQVTSSGIPSQESSVSAQLIKEIPRDCPALCKKHHIPCNCDKENIKPTDSMCHIFIKLKDDDEPDVVVKSSEEAHKQSEVKSVDVGVQIPSSEKEPVISRFKKPDTKTDSTLEKSRTWREQFSKNSISTTSTSYFSPPDFQKKTRLDYFKKPQQRELSAIYSQSQDFSREHLADPTVPLCIKKLLSMTRVSVENLSVSSSTIETPSQSLIEMDSNNPQVRLPNLVDPFKNKVNGVGYSPEHSSPVHYNTSASVCSSQKSCKEVDSKNTLPDQESYDCSKFRENILAQYTQITDDCSKRIEALADMIQQLRKDKLKMLQVSSNISKSPLAPEKDGKDASTTYMDLPEYKTDSKESSKHSSSSLDEEEIYKRLMEINHEFSGKMKKINQSTKDRDTKTTSKEICNASANSVVAQDCKDGCNNTNQELQDRINRLHGLPQIMLCSENEQFESFLSDIPRLPKFEPQENNTSLPHKRPPLSKGLTSIKKLNGNVSVVPHELSTIVEADSQISTKVPSPETSRDSVNFNLKPQLLAIPEIQEGVSSASTPDVSVPKKFSGDLGVTKESATQSSVNTSLKDESNQSLELPKVTLNCSSKSKELNKPCDDTTCPESKKLSTSSSDDMENIENMLRSIGMEWAIPTLHKTQEALALTSSSSSLDFSRKKPNKSTGSLGGSEVSLREFLKKQILRISSSTMLSEESIGSFLGECSELSGIQKNTNSTREKSRQRTSTPLGSSKFTNSSKSNEAFSDSELSSIRQECTKSKKDKKNKK